MVYVAGNKEGKLKLPVSDVSVLRDSPVASFVADTIAPGISALPGSTTVPEIVPVVVCARSGIMAHVLKMSIEVINSKRWTSSQQISIERMRFVMAPSPHLGFSDNKKAAPCICTGRLSWTLPPSRGNLSRTLERVN